MATTKMTKATAFAIALELVNQSAHPEKDEVSAKLAKEIENLSKKSAGSGKPTKTQLANMALAEGIADWMTPGVAYSISDISKHCPAVLGETPQKIRPLLTTLIQQKVVERTEVKGKPMFTRYAEEEDWGE